MSRCPSRFAHRNEFVALRAINFSPLGAEQVWAQQLEPARVRNCLVQDNVKAGYSHLEEIIAKILAHKKA